MQDWRNRKRISHDESASAITRVCHVPNLGPFPIGLAIRDGVPVLTHHGVAALPGKLTVVTQAV